MFHVLSCVPHLLSCHKRFAIFAHRFYVFFTLTFLNRFNVLFFCVKYFAHIVISHEQIVYLVARVCELNEKNRRKMNLQKNLKCNRQQNDLNRGKWDIYTHNHTNTIDMHINMYNKWMWMDVYGIEQCQYLTKYPKKKCASIKTDYRISLSIYHSLSYEQSANKNKQTITNHTLKSYSTSKKIKSRRSCTATAIKKNINKSLKKKRTHYT